MLEGGIEFQCKQFEGSKMASELSWLPYKFEGGKMYFAIVKGGTF